MANREDVRDVELVVVDTLGVLDWAAGEAFLFDEGSDMRPVLPVPLQPIYSEAVNQLQDSAGRLALATLRGQNPDCSMTRLEDVLRDAGWDGALKDFKLAVLAELGRNEVTEVTRGGRRRGGRLPRRVFNGFLGGLDAALDSLDGIPGAGGIRELKDFLERVTSR